VKLDLKRNVGNDTQYLTFHLARQPIAKFPEPSIGAMPSTTPAGHANGQQRAQRLALGGGGGGGGGTGGGLQQMPLGQVAGGAVDLSDPAGVGVCSRLRAQVEARWQ